MTKDELIQELRTHLSCAIALLEERDRYGQQATPTSEKVIREARELLAEAWKARS